jgi:hypothetical protein
MRKQLEEMGKALQTLEASLKTPTAEQPKEQPKQEEPATPKP